MKKATKKLLEIIQELEKDYSFNDCMENYIDTDELEEAIQTDQDYGDSNEVRNYLEGLNDEYQITDTEVIYYSNAIQYLAEHDPSLRESIEIASEYGLDLERVNSELLASLLQSRNNQNDYAEFIDKVIEKFEE